ncbi:unnamed protein product, partial [Ascophyllum nodosum]
DSAGPSSTWTKTTGYGSVAVNDGVEADASLWSRVRDDFEVLRKKGEPWPTGQGVSREHTERFQNVLKALATVRHGPYLEQ